MYDCTRLTNLTNRSRNRETRGKWGKANKDVRKHAQYSSKRMDFSEEQRPGHRATEGGYISQSGLVGTYRHTVQTIGPEGESTNEIQKENFVTSQRIKDYKDT